MSKNTKFSSSSQVANYMVDSELGDRQQETFKFLSRLC